MRGYDKPLYPSRCYAVPETSAFNFSPYPEKNLPILFIGVDVAEFNETDPSTRLLYTGEEVHLIHGDYI